MAARYWVGGTGTWSAANTANWSATSGGAGGASVPTSADTPIFDGNSGSGVVTFTNGGVTVGATTINNSGIELSLGAAFVTSGTLLITTGTFTTNNYNVTTTLFRSNQAFVRTISFGSSTVTITGNSQFDFGTSESVRADLSFNAGTSQVIQSGNTFTFNGNNQTFYNVSFTSTTIGTATVNGANIFNNLSVTGLSSSGIANISLSDDQTINGTLTLSAGANATIRTFVRSNTIGTTRTLTCAAVASLQDIDFRDITIAGAAAPVSGTRLGDCKGNSGVTFDAGKTVYWRNATSANWGATTWSATEGGTADVTQLPLAQDTAIIPSGYPNSGQTVTINASYNIGTIDMSARTSNTMTLACSPAPSIYGNWINGTGTTLTGTGQLTFAGRGSQTITSAGRTFTQSFAIYTPGGSVTLQDAFETNRSSTVAFTINNGTIDADVYNFSLTGATARFSSLGTDSKTIAIGSGTWTISGSGTAWNITSAANLTVTGTGTISFTSASAKSFDGGGVQTYPTINQGGAGTLTILGSNKFTNISNTAIGRVQFQGGQINEFTSSFVLNGTSGNLLQLGSTNTTAVTLKKPTAWNVGANSTDGGNNTGLSFTAGDMDYLSISYVNGEVLPAAASNIYWGSTNIASIYYGSTAVTSIYYGSTKVFG